MAALLFVAVVPPPDAVAGLRALVDELRREAPELSWVAPQRWHVTVCFLGAVEPTPPLLDGLATVAASSAPVRVGLEGGGRFGDRVLWAGVRGDLPELAARVAGAARGAGVAVEERPFRAHLTLARGRRGARLAPLAARLTSVTGSWTADSLVLMRSARPEYEQVASWPLAG